MTIKETTWNDLSDYRDSLEHYGVKGMRWGVRKQRETSGRKRSSSSSTSKKKRKTFSERVQARRTASAKAKVAKAKARAEKEAADAKAKAEKDAAKQQAKRQKILDNPTLLYKNRKQFTADEIQNAMKQYDWEKRLNQYSKDQLNNGAEFINTMFKYVNNSINLYNAAARVVNTLSDDANLPYVPPAKKEEEKPQQKKNQNK